MQKNIFFIVLFALLGTACVGAQESDYTFERSNVLKINPFGFGNSEFQVAYERYLANRRMSVSVIPSFILKDTPEDSRTGFQLAAQYRFYLTHFNKNQRKTFLGMENYGFYAGIYAKYLNLEEEFSEGYYDKETQEYVTDLFTKNVSAIEGGTVIGVQIDITPRLLLDLYVGGGVRYTDVEDTYRDILEGEDVTYYRIYNVFDEEYQGVKPTGGLLLGVIF